MSTRGHHGVMLAAAGYPVFSRLNFPGADGSTTITDETGIPWAAVGNAQIDTSLGYNTCLFDGAGDYIKTTATANIVGGPFCLEQWIYMLAAPSASAIMFCQDDGTNNSQNFQVVISTGRVLSFTGWSGGSRGSYWTVATGSNLIPTGALCHYAIDFDGVHTRLFIGGTMRGDATNVMWEGSVLPLTIGSLLDGPNDESAFAKFNGHIVSSRVTLASRYTANFTPPSPPLSE